MKERNNPRQKAFIYGTGNRCMQVIHITLFDCMIEVIAFVDSDVKKQGKIFEGKYIISPKDIDKYEYDIILIASVYFAEIKNDLIHKYNIKPEKIIDDAQKYIQNRSLKKRYDNHNLRKKQEGVYNKPDKIAVYTAIFGNYDELIEPKYISNNCDYICFTDNLNLKSNVWEIIHVNNEGKDHNRAAKIYKVLPHIFLKDYNFSIWVDANFEILGDLRFLLDQYLDSRNIVVMIHPIRNCIYEEAEFCKLSKKDSILLIDNQIKRYHNDGYPLNNGLISGGFILRKHNDFNVIKLMELWWNEINCGSKRDQISFNYVAWKIKFEYDVLPLNVYDNSYFKVLSHKEDKCIK